MNVCCCIYSWGGEGWGAFSPFYKFLCPLASGDRVWLGRATRGVGALGTYSSEPSLCCHETLCTNAFSVFHQIQNVLIIRSIILWISQKVKTLPKNNDMLSIVKCVSITDVKMWSNMHYSINEIYTRFWGEDLQGPDLKQTSLHHMGTLWRVASEEEAWLVVVLGIAWAYACENGPQV